MSEFNIEKEVREVVAELGVLKVLIAIMTSDLCS